MIMFGSFLPSLLVGFSTTNFTRASEPTLSWNQLRLLTCGWAFCVYASLPNLNRDGWPHSSPVLARVGSLTVVQSVPAACPRFRSVHSARHVIRCRTREQCLSGEHTGSA